jgi:hypothetical protein
MVRIFFFIIFVSAVILVLGIVQLLLLRQLNRPWWNRKWIRRAAYTLPVLGVILLLVYGLAEYYRISWLSTITAPLTVIAVIMEFALMLSLPVSGLIHMIGRLVEWMAHRRHEATDTVVDVRRRALLKGAAAAVPVAAIAAGFGGVGRAYAGAEVRLEPIAMQNLPPSLQGLRILQISDAHLRHYVTLDDLEEILDKASAFAPDLVLVTGDLSDDLTMLPDALRLIDQSRTPLGSYAILGNHEYFRGIAQVRAIFDRSPVPLLVDRHVRLSVGEQTICLGGIDDPMTMRGIPADFFSAAIDMTFLDAGHYDFSILMSHRPDAFPDAAARGIDLTLAGHTHGGQIGFGGRSVLETSFPNSFLWGKYTLGQSQLYTSCGAGHWFPFRLGCPAEAPVIELTAA